MKVLHITVSFVIVIKQEFINVDATKTDFAMLKYKMNEQIFVRNVSKVTKTKQLNVLVIKNFKTISRARKRVLHARIKLQILNQSINKNKISIAERWNKRNCVTLTSDVIKLIVFVSLRQFRSTVLYSHRKQTSSELSLLEKVVLWTRNIKKMLERIYYIQLRIHSCSHDLLFSHDTSINLKTCLNGVHPTKKRTNYKEIP